MFILGWMKAVPWLEADTLESIPTSSHNSLSGKKHEWVEGIGWGNFPEGTVCLETIIGQFEINWGPRSDSQCNASGSNVLDKQLFYPMYRQKGHPQGHGSSPDQPRAQPKILPCFLSLAETVLEHKSLSFGMSLFFFFFLQNQYLKKNKKCSRKWRKQYFFYCAQAFPHTSLLALLTFYPIYFELSLTCPCSMTWLKVAFAKLPTCIFHYMGVCTQQLLSWCSRF